MKELTSRERILSIVNGDIPDRVPATVHQWQHYHLKHYMHCDDALDAFLQVGLDALIYPPWINDTQSEYWQEHRSVTSRPDGSREIVLTVTTPKGALTQKSISTDYTTSEIEYLVKNPDDIYLVEKYWPVPKMEHGAVLSEKKRLGDNGIYRAFTNGPQGSPWQDACCFCGTENMIYFSYDRPEWVIEFLGILLEKKIEFYKNNLIPGVFEMIETGGGAASNTVISPKMFKKFCLPFDKKQHDIIHDIDPNIAISYHTCGGMLKLLDLIPQNGCDFSETLSPVGCGGDIRDGIDEKTVKQILGSKVKLIGGINQIQALTYGSKNDIYEDVKRAFEGYGKNGGYIMMGSDHFFHAPKENLVHYANAVKDICRYN